MQTYQVFGISIVLWSMFAMNGAQEGTVCTLPDAAATSKCTRLHYCTSLFEYAKNIRGRPTPADEAHIGKYSCAMKPFICCPDNAVPIPVVQPPVDLQKPTATSSDLPPRIDLNEIRNHPNFHLINVKCGQSSTDRITNGYKAKPGDLPWMALLQYKNRLDETLTFNCGGSLITPRFVLTAAHCITRELVNVRLGEHDINTEKDCDAQNKCLDPVQDIEIQDRIKHPQYDNRKKINDIALLKLKTAADVSKKNVRTICLPTESDNQIDVLGKDVLENLGIAGWGRTESGKASNVLMRGNVPYVSNAKCAERLGSLRVPVYDTYLCAGGKNKTDTCNGDSGGPISGYGSVDDKPKQILYGVVSVGIDCLNPDKVYPSIYTNVAYYMKWILNTITV